MSLCFAVHLLNELVHESNKDAEEARRIAAAFLQKVTSSDPVVKWKVWHSYYDKMISEERSAAFSQGSFAFILQARLP
jgi:hypothetical protein